MKKVGRYRHTDGEANGRTDCERERERKKERGNAFLKRTDLKVEKNEDERFKKKNKPDSYQMII